MQKLVMKDSVNAEDEDDEDDEDELLAAAANWAGTGEGEKDYLPDRVERKLEHYALSEKKKDYSLHVTQLSYEATDYDIRDLFMSKGCLVTSVRLVFKPDEKTLIRKFTGVAFVDVADEDSFKNGLALHRTHHLGRRINVRPTRSKEELTHIVEKTKEKVSALIQASSRGEGTIHKGKKSLRKQSDKAVSPNKKENKNRKLKNNTAKAAYNETEKQEKPRKDNTIKKSKEAIEGNYNDAVAAEKAKHWIKKGADSETETKEKSAHLRKEQRSKKASKAKSPKSKTKDPVKRKITKQERNRRAAILLGRGGTKGLGGKRRKN